MDFSLDYPPNFSILAASNSVFCPFQASQAVWLSALRAAHGLGMPSGEKPQTHKSQHFVFIFQVTSPVDSFDQFPRPSNNFLKCFAQILSLLSAGRLVHHSQKLEPHYTLLSTFMFAIFQNKL